jgi:hypothetical protein
MWLHIDVQVDKLADDNFPRRTSSRVPNAFELLAHPTDMVYFDQSEATCMVTVRAVAHLARLFPVP